MQEDKIADLALIVESRFSSRKEIASELSNTSLVGSILEAQSVHDALYLLSEKELDACFLGPSLSRDVAVSFLEEGKNTSKAKHCAFVAILNADSDYAQALMDAGADGTINQPLRTGSFTELVKKAVAVARSREAAPLQVQEQFLSQFLTNTASGLRLVAKDIANGSLKLSQEGVPSLATRDAIRVTLENTFLPLGHVPPIGSFGHHFISAVVEWFVERINTPERTATENLRRRLIAYHQQAESTH